MRPTVGRIVHYTNLGDADGKYPPEQQAAIITKVTGEEGEHPAMVEEKNYSVSIHIFYPTGQFDMQDVPFSNQYKRGHWSWPSRDEE
jgi:hypothetical protein